MVMIVANSPFGKGFASNGTGGGVGATRGAARRLTGMRLRAVAAIRGVAGLVLRFGLTRPDKPSL